MRGRIAAGLLRRLLLAPLLLASGSPAVELEYECIYRFGVSFGVVGRAHVRTQQVEDGFLIALRVESDPGTFLGRRADIVYERTAVLDEEDYSLVRSSVAYEERIDLPWIHKEKAYSCRARRTEDGVVYAENEGDEELLSVEPDRLVYDPLSPVAAGLLDPEALLSRGGLEGLVFDRGRLSEQAVELRSEQGPRRRSEERVAGEGDRLSFLLARMERSEGPLLPVEIKMHLRPGFLVARLCQRSGEAEGK